MQSQKPSKTPELQAGSPKESTPDSLEARADRTVEQMRANLAALSKKK